MSVETIRELPRQLPGNTAVLVRKDREYFVVSSSPGPRGPETLAFKATSAGKIANWYPVAGGYDKSRADVLAALETRGAR